MADTFAKGRALVVGIADYQRVQKLPSSVLDDARDVSALFQAADFCGYPPANVELLLDTEATLDGIRRALKRLVLASAPDETVVFYFSGHGGRNVSGEYLLPIDSDPKDLAGTALSSAELTSELKAIRAERLVVLLDACHSAGAAQLKGVDPAEGVKAGLSDEACDQLAQGKGRVMMASCRSNESSFVLGGMKNSLFTHHLLDALRGKASAEKVVRVFEVFHYVSEKVPAQEKYQHPIFKAHDLENNFPLALARGGKGVGEPDTPSSAARLDKLSGKAKLAISERLVTRWESLAIYFDISLADQAKFQRGHEPRHIIDWLEQRGRLGELQDAFNHLGWHDLVEEINRHPQ